MSHAPETLAESAATIRRSLWRVYQTCLPRFFLPDVQMVARSLEWQGDQWRTTEPCPLNTAEVLKALFSLQAHGLPVPIDPAPMMDQLVTQQLKTADQQVLALMLWAAAIGRPQHVPTLMRELDARPPSTQSLTLGWTLSALSCTMPTLPGGHAASAAARSVERLLANQNRSTGLFRASDRREGLLRRPRPQASLSSQTFAIAGLAAYGRASGDDRAIAAATRCMTSLVSLQGPLGQWWRDYDTRGGAVVEHYPVFCTSQDSAVPLACADLPAAAAHWDGAVHRGLLWCAGPNETGTSLIDEQRARVARSVGNAGVDVSWELYAYQPARFVMAVFARPDWVKEVAA